MDNGVICHRDRCCALIEREFREQLDRAEPDVARLSLLLGAAEQPLTCKDTSLQQWPVNLEVCQDECILFYWMAGGRRAASPVNLVDTGECLQEDVSAADSEFDGFIQSLHLERMDARVCTYRLLTSFIRRQLKVCLLSTQRMPI